jgi:hypothetical protein
MIRIARLGAMLALFAALSLLPAAFSVAADEGTSLFNGKDLTGWKPFLDPKSTAKPEDVWSVKDGVLICKGKPNGYVITDKEYENYVLTLEWRWEGKKGNSGVLLHVTGPDKIWPKSAEAQLLADHAGDFWLVDGFKMDVDAARQDPRTPRHFLRLNTDKPVEKPVGEWNKYEITCKGNTITLKINDQLVNEGKNAEVGKGKILLQSEGAEIHFRNVKLQPIK